MSKAASRIGNIDFDAQAAAREAARREGKSLGQWLHGAIADRAADLGVRESDLVGRERIEAITARLDRLGGRAVPSGPAPRRPTQAGRGDGIRPRFHEAPTRETAARDGSIRDVPLDERRAHRRSPAEDGPSDGRLAAERDAPARSWAREIAHDPAEDPARDFARDFAEEPAADALLADAVAAMERRHARSERRTDEALASFAQLMETNEARRAQERDAVHALTRQMAAMESTLTERIGTSDSPIRGALARLEARLDQIGKRSATERAAREQAAAAEDEPLRRLEDKINSLLQVVHGAPGRPAAGAAAAPVAPSFAPPVEASPLAIRAAQAAEPPRRRLGDAIAEISRRQQSLESQSGPELRQGAGPGGPATAAALVETRGEAAEPARRASDRAERQGEPLRAVPSHRAEVPVEQERLREEIAAITARMGALPSAAQAAERAREAAARDRIERERVEAERLAARAEAERAMTQLESERAAARAEAERAAARLDAERAARLEAERSARVEAERLARLATERQERPDPATAASLNKIEQRLDAIAGRVGEVLDRPALEPQLGTLEAMVRDLAARLDAAGSRHAEGQAADGQALGELQQQVEVLVGRFERSESDLAVLPTLAASVRRLFDQLETVRSSVETSAAETARETAREVLRIAAEDRGRQPAGEPARPAGAEPEVMVAVQSMLGDVHDVLDKLVGRLTAVEGNLAEVRARSAAQPSDAPARSPIAQPAAAQPAVAQPAVAQPAVAPAIPAQSAPSSAAAPGLAVPPSAPAFSPAMPPLGSAGAASTGPVFRPATQRPAAPRMSDGDGAREPTLAAPGRRIEAPAAARFAAEADEDAQRLNFIAAARRAAKSAQMEAAQLDASQALKADGAVPRRPAADDRPASEAEVRAGLLTKSREYVAAHKRPVLMGLAAILVVVGTLALLQRTGLGGAEMVAQAPQAPQPARIALAVPPAPEAGSRAIVAAADELTPSALPRAAATGTAAAGPFQVAATQSGASQSGASQAGPSQAASGPQAPADAAPPASPAGASARIASTGATDATPTGSITSLPSFAAQSPTVQTPMAMVRAPVVPGLPPGLLAAAEGGNAAAQYDLGARYADGRTVGRDAKLAATWLGKAAEQNLAPAQYRLAMMYEKGIGVATDKPRARTLYAAAAEAGNPRAMHNLAVMLADGDGHPDYAAAAGWFRKAAGYGIHDSQYNLAILLARGLGATQSLVQSYQWFAVAAAQNDADAAHKRDEVGSKLNASDLALAKSLAAAYQPKAADPAALEASFPPGAALPAGDGALGASRLNSVKSKVSSL